MAVDTKLAEDMAASARSAVELTKTQFHTVLDYGVHSLEKLEQLFDRVEYAMANPDSKETTGLLTRLWGSYLGEVIRKKHGGEWLIWNDEHGKAIALQIGNALIFPFNKIKKRLERGPGQNVWEYYQHLSASLPGTSGQ
jgi:hypothetical protein